MYLKVERQELLRRLDDDADAPERLDEAMRAVTLADPSDSVLPAPFGASGEKAVVIERGDTDTDESWEWPLRTMTLTKRRRRRWHEEFRLGIRHLRLGAGLPEVCVQVVPPPSRRFCLLTALPSAGAGHSADG